MPVKIYLQMNLMVALDCWNPSHESFPVTIPCLSLPQDTLPEDVKGMFVSEGVLCHLGGMTSHAAVVARGWGKPCVCGCEPMHIDEENKVR